MNATTNNNARIDPVTSASGKGSRSNAINACKVMDTVLSTPTLHQNLFTDSIQLFPDDILHEARLHNTLHKCSDKKQQQNLNEIMNSLKTLVEQTQHQINETLSKNPTMKKASSSLKMDTTTLAFFDSASHQLLRAIHTFQESYGQNRVSRQVLEHQQYHGSKYLTEQDTVPGLDQAAKKLYLTQEALLNMISNIHTIQESISLLKDPSSQIQQAITDVRQDLVHGTDNVDIEAYLDRLYSMSTTLERALQRKK